jgi:hypothetical protein
MLIERRPILPGPFRTAAVAMDIPHRVPEQLSGLDQDDGLVSEGFRERDLLVGE